MAYNHPYRENVTVHKHRELFTDYGTCFSRDIDEFCQVNNKDNVTKYAALHPVLPLSSKPNIVSLPVQDRIMGQVIQDNKDLQYFSNKVRHIRNQSKRYEERYGNTIDEIYNAVEVARDDGSIDRYTDAHHNKWFQELTSCYMKIKDTEAKLYNNHRYTGGCIAVLPIDNSHFYTVSACGTGFKTLQFKMVSEKLEGVLQSYNINSLNLPGTIYGVKARRVQHDDICCVRTANKCLLYKVQTTEISEEKCLHEINQVKINKISAVDISPYIPDEYVIVNETGTCYLYCNGKLETINDSIDPRFPVSDPWRSIQYASHPRHILYADQTVLQLLDLRVRDSEGHDLFSLPSKLLHNRERIRLCGRHEVSSFYHIMATDYNLMILDERFPKYPVLQWDHLLSCPPQYISCVQQQQPGGGEVTDNDNFIYIGNQLPSDIHGFRFSYNQSKPPSPVSLPYKCAKIESLCSWPEFMEVCGNKDFLKERLKMSLAGVACTPIKNGHVVLQLSCHGDIFHQAFFPSQSSENVSFSRGIRDQHLKLHSVAMDTAHCWIEAWTTQIKKLSLDFMKSRPVNLNQWGVLHFREPHKCCMVCRPDICNIPGFSDNTNTQNAVCISCETNTVYGEGLVQATHKDEVVPSPLETQGPRGLKNVEDLPRNTALTKLICAQYEDSIHDDLEDIMQHWDEEVKEKRKALKSKVEELPDMSEESVLARITARSLQDNTSQSLSTTLDIGGSLDVLGPSVHRMVDTQGGSVSIDSISIESEMSSIADESEAGSVCIDRDNVIDDLVEKSKDTTVDEVASNSSNDTLSDMLDTISSYEKSRTLINDNMPQDKPIVSNTKMAPPVHRTRLRKNSTSNKSESVCELGSGVIPVLTEKLKQNNDDNTNTSIDSENVFKIPSCSTKTKLRPREKKKDTSGLISGWQRLFTSPAQMKPKRSKSSAEVCSGSKSLLSSPEKLFTDDESVGEESSVLSLVNLPGLNISNVLNTQNISTSKNVSTSHLSRFQHVPASQNVSSSRHVPASQNVSTTQHVPASQNVSSSQNLQSSQNISSSQNSSFSQSLPSFQKVPSSQNLPAPQNKSDILEMLEMSEDENSQSIFQDLSSSQATRLKSPIKSPKSVRRKLSLKMGF